MVVSGVRMSSIRKLPSSRVRDLKYEARIGAWQGNFRYDPELSTL